MRVVRRSRQSDSRWRCQTCTSSAAVASITGDRFAIGYVQFDHFKEYSERYGRDRCARVISLVDRILRDVVAIRCRTDGFVTQIGKVAFTFVVPVDAMTDVCVQVLDMFDSEIP